MKQILVYLTLLGLCLCLKSRDHLQSHALDEDLCKEKGGVVCGKLIKDCCEVGC